MEMRRNYNLSPTDLTQCANMIPESLMWLHICVIQQIKGKLIVHSPTQLGDEEAEWSFVHTACGLEKPHCIDTWL